MKHNERLVDAVAADLRRELARQSDVSTVPGFWFDDTRDLVDGTVDLMALATAALSAAEAAGWLIMTNIDSPESPVSMVEKC